MSTTVKIYQSKMINELLAAASFKEVKNKIDTTFLKLKELDLPDTMLLKFIDDVLTELLSLNLSRLPYDHYVNIITAKVHLKERQLQMFNVIN